MNEIETYASYALLQELNRREFRKKLCLFPDEQRHYAILAAGIIGTETAKRTAGTPEAVVRDGEEFASELRHLVNPDEDALFREVLYTYLIEAIRDELRFCCSNCIHFTDCLNLDSLKAGRLFKLCTEGHETDEIKKELTLSINQALQQTPYLDTEQADSLCKEFRHHYTASTIANVFNRYADIAADLQQRYGIDYKQVQKQIIEINMDFYARSQK